MTTSGKTIQIRLADSVDPSQPILAAKITRGGSKAKSVLVLSDHPVWRGATLTERDFKRVKDVAK